MQVYTIICVILLKIPRARSYRFSKKLILSFKDDGIGGEESNFLTIQNQENSVL